MATYLVTGVAGFIASRVAALLLVDGHTVVGIDNVNDAYDPRLKQWRLAQVQDHPRFFFQHVDICDRAQLHEVFKPRHTDHDRSFNAVINLAARAGVRSSVHDPWMYFQTNTTGTLNVLELCREYDVPKFVLASTSSVYGSHNPLPFREDADTSLPLSPYAASKKAAEELCYTYHYLHGFDVTILRYFTVYGPAGRPDMSPFRFVQWISEGTSVTVFGDGTQSRDFTYVDDIAHGTIAGVGLSGYNIVNLGSDQPIILMDAIHLIEELIGKQAKLEFRPNHPADMPATWADIRRAKTLLHWQPQTPFAAGMRELVLWYQQHRAWAKEIRT